MKIGIVGSHCVGKTTLAKALSQHLSLPLIEEQLRSSQRQFLEIGYPTLNSIINTMWYPHFVFDLIRRQIECEDKESDSFISDRTVMDYYIYYQHLSTAPVSQKEILKSVVSDRFSKQYDNIIYLPIAFPIVGDGYRDTDSDFREQMDVHILEATKHHEGFFALNAQTVNDRVAETLNFLKRRYGTRSIMEG